MWSLIDSSTAARSIKNYDFRISRSEIWPSLVYLLRASWLTTLDIYETYFLCVKLLHLYAIGFYNQVLRDLHYCWNEELCSQLLLFKLLELVTCLESVQRVIYKLEDLCIKWKNATTRSSQIRYLSKGSIVDWYFGIGQGGW